MSQKRFADAHVACAVLLAALAASCGGRANSPAEPYPIEDPPASVPPVTGPDPGSEVAPPPAASCEENPLLSECTCNADNFNSDCDGAPEPCDLYPAIADCPPLERPSPERSVESILAENCGQCHGPALTVAQAQAGVNFVTDLDALVENGWLIECAARQSPVVLMFRTDHGWDESVGYAFGSPEGLEAVASAIDEGCTDTRSLCAEQPALEGCAKVQAERVLDQRCGMCHGEAQRDRQSVTGVNAFSFLQIDDMTTMIRSGLVVPCDSEASVLVQRMRDGSMPPAGSEQPSLRPSDEARITGFIDGLCGPPATPELQAESTRLEDVLRSSCGECHGPAAISSGQLQGGELPEELESLKRDGWLIPCNSDGSVLLERMRSGSMPPLDSVAPRPSPADIEALAALVDRPCAAPVP